MYVFIGQVEWLNIIRRIISQEGKIKLITAMSCIIWFVEETMKHTWKSWCSLFTRWTSPWRQEENFLRHSLYCCSVNSLWLLIGFDHKFIKVTMMDNKVHRITEIIIKTLTSDTSKSNHHRLYENLLRNYRWITLSKNNLQFNLPFYDYLLPRSFRYYLSNFNNSFIAICTSH